MSCISYEYLLAYQSFSDQNLSVVRRRCCCRRHRQLFTFSSSPQEPLN